MTLGAGRLPTFVRRAGGRHAPVAGFGAVHWGRLFFLVPWRERLGSRSTLCPLLALGPLPCLWLGRCLLQHGLRSSSQFGWAAAGCPASLLASRSASHSSPATLGRWRLPFLLCLRLGRSRTSLRRTGCWRRGRPLPLVPIPTSTSRCAPSDRTPTPTSMAWLEVRRYAGRGALFPSTAYLRSRRGRGAALFSLREKFRVGSGRRVGLKKVGLAVVAACAA